MTESTSRAKKLLSIILLHIVMSKRLITRRKKLSQGDYSSTEETKNSFELDNNSGLTFFRPSKVKTIKNYVCHRECSNYKTELTYHISDLNDTEETNVKLDPVTWFSSTVHWHKCELELDSDLQLVTGDTNFEKVSTLDTGPVAFPMSFNCKPLWSLLGAPEFEHW